MPNARRKNQPGNDKTEDDAPPKKERKPGPARQTLLDAARGKETVLRFDTAQIAKGAAYGWWGARRRAQLTDQVAIKLDTKAMTVTIGPRTDAPEIEPSDPVSEAENAEASDDQTSS